MKDFSKGMTKENFNLYLQKLAERLDAVTRDIDPWNYESEISNNNGVEISKETLANDPYAVIEFLIDSVEMLLG